MKLEDAQKHYYELSGLASSGARQLAFAGIAVVWILATEVNIVEQPTLRAPLIVFVLALMFDLLHYYVGAALWGMFARRKDKAGEVEFTGAPDSINWFQLGAFWVKGGLVVLGYVMLVVLLWSRLFMGSSAAQ